MKGKNMTEDMAENRSLWHMKIKVGPLLHGGGLGEKDKSLHIFHRCWFCRNL